MLLYSLDIRRNQCPLTQIKVFLQLITIWQSSSKKNDEMNFSQKLHYLKNVSMCPDSK